MRVSVLRSVTGRGLHLPEGPARTLLLNIMSRLRLHVLDTRLPVERELRKVEAHIAALLGLELK